MRHPLLVSCAILSAFVTPVFGQGVDTNDPSLPPTVGEYRTPQQVHASYGGGQLVLQTIRHFGFTNIVRQSVGNDELESFDSQVDGLAVIFPNPNPVPVNMTGPVQTRVENKIGNTTGTFDTEMLSMNLSGGGGMIRESPTLPSTGQTTITSLGGGMYHIDSFFDVFTELSIDGGQTWIPQDNGPTRMELMPEPSALALSGLTLLVLRTGRRRAG